MSKLVRYICDRMNGAKYGAPEFYWWVSENLPEEDARPILDAIDGRDEIKVKQAIYEHFNKHDLYPLALAYVRSVQWLEDDPEESVRMSVSFFAPLRNAITGKEEFTEVYYSYYVPTRLSVRRQVQQGFEMALKAGMKIWRGCSLEYHTTNSNNLKADYIDIYPDKDDRDRLEQEFKVWQAINLNKPYSDWQPLNVKVKYNITGTDWHDEECKARTIERTLTLAVLQHPIITNGREAYGIQKKGDDYDE